MNRYRGLIVALAVLAGVPGFAQTDTATPRRATEPVVGLPCEGCDLVFAGWPDTLTSDSRITRPEEPGEPLRITGQVFAPGGDPAPGVIVYIYHTGADGLYPPGDGEGRASRRHGRLRGWARSDADGHYAFTTIRPAGYPGTDLPAHVHMHVVEIGRCTYYIDDILFEDDPRLTDRKLAELVTGRGGNGVVDPQPDGEGGWVARRDIHLGRDVPGYPR